MQRFLASVMVLVVFVVSTGCSHGVIIDSEPAGAEVKVNGEKIGTTPVTYNETTGWEKIYDVEFSKPGFKPIKKQVKQTEWNVPVVVVSVGGILLFWWLLFPIASPIGLLWSRQLPDRVHVSLEKGSGASTGGGSTGGDSPPSYGY